jgi:hypothetical protein
VKGKYFTAILSAGILAVALFACNKDPWILGDAPTDKVTITKVTEFGKAQDGVTPLKGNVGAVKMSHKTHEEQGLKCVDCHHKANNPERTKQCARCHIGEKGYQTMHGLCLDCHIAKNDGPQKCMECH